jgi:alpha-galactosidase
MESAMNRRPKIVVIGAGSASFGLSVLGRLLLEPGLAGSHLCLVDKNAEGLEQIGKLAARLNREWGSEFTLETSTDRTEVLSDADFVILSIAIDREACWRKDFEIAQKYRIMHYAENGGPGAFAHTARNLAVVMDILRDIERLCPDAWLLNFTNPVPRICRAATRYTRIKTIGICHQIGFGYMMIGNFLQKELGIDAPAGYRFYWQDPDRAKTEHGIADKAKQQVRITAAGINHFTWMLDIRHRQTGQDLYPLLWKSLETFDPGFEPLTQEVAKIYGLLPVSGDCHMCEYLPYSHNMDRGVWERYDIQMYDLTKASNDRDLLWEKIRAMADGKESVESLKASHSERAEKVIAAMVSGEAHYEEALNLPNQGAIGNLPEGAIVETPAVVGGGAPRAVVVGDLPEPVAELCRRQITLVDLVVEAAVEGDRRKALQALALDPMVDDPQVAKDLLDEMLTVFSDYLPQFATQDSVSAVAG